MDLSAAMLQILTSKAAPARWTSWTLQDRSRVSALRVAWALALITMRNQRPQWMGSAVRREAAVRRLIRAVSKAALLSGAWAEQGVPVGAWGGCSGAL